MRKSIVALIVIVVIGVAVHFTGFLSPVFDSAQATTKKVALFGYDPVAYYTIGYATKGSEEFEVAHNGDSWLFSKAEHRDSFIANPDKYLPLYDGLCSYMIAYGKQEKSDPKLWIITDEKLYMNCSIEAHLKWQYDLDNNIKKADLNWEQISKN
ncbi:MAG: YHS domain protein [Alphaproteobacteria bacterium]|nr:YHS domain protein [Alphaproteobacteria bacterium]